MRFVLASLVALVIAAFPALAQSAGRDGSTPATAIVIEAPNTQAGIAQEYAYVRRAYPGWERVRQALIEHEGRRYDRLTIRSPSGETRDVFFDITSFFGKM